MVKSIKTTLSDISTVVHNAAVALGVADEAPTPAVPEIAPIKPHSISWSLPPIHLVPFNWRKELPELIWNTLDPYRLRQAVSAVTHEEVAILIRNSKVAGKAEAVRHLQGLPEILKDEDPLRNDATAHIASVIESLSYNLRVNQENSCDCTRADELTKSRNMYARMLDEAIADLHEDAQLDALTFYRRTQDDMHQQAARRLEASEAEDL